MRLLYDVMMTFETAINLYGVLVVATCSIAVVHVFHDDYQSQLN